MQDKPKKGMSIIIQQDATIYSLLYFCRLLYLFRLVIPPIIRSTYNCNYSIWHWSKHLCYLLLSLRSWNCSSNFFTVITVISAPDDGWNNHPKHVEQSTEI